MHFIEHGLAPDAKVAKWQHRLNPLEKRLAGGCNLNRPIDTLIEQAGFSFDELETFYGKGPKSFSYLYRGRGVPRLTAGAFRQMTAGARLVVRTECSPQGAWDKGPSHSDASRVLLSSPLLLPEHGRPREERTETVWTRESSRHIGGQEGRDVEGCSVFGAGR